MHYAISNQVKIYYSRIIFLNFLNVYGLLIWRKNESIHYIYYIFKKVIER